MKKNNYWISIGDLMSGVVGVLVLFFVITILAVITSQVAIQEEKQRGAREVVRKLKEQSRNNNLSQGVEFFIDQGLIRLTDTSFAQGSACINDNQKYLLQHDMSNIIIEELSKNENLGVQIEGHTDIVPVSTSNSRIFRSCAPFDDNYTLSAGRAREARNAIFSQYSDISDNWIKRISVVGYGPDRLIDTENPNSDKNRRVEIRFINIDN